MTKPQSKEEKAKKLEATKVRTKLKKRVYQRTLHFQTNITKYFETPCKFPCSEDYKEPTRKNEQRWRAMMKRTGPFSQELMEDGSIILLQRHFVQKALQGCLEHIKSLSVEELISGRGETRFNQYMKVCYEPSLSLSMQILKKIRSNYVEDVSDELEEDADVE